MNGALILCLLLAIANSFFLWFVMGVTRGNAEPSPDLPSCGIAYRLELKRAENGIGLAMVFVSCLGLWALFVILLIVKWIVG